MQLINNFVSRSAPNLGVGRFPANAQPIAAAEPVSRLEKEIRGGTHLGKTRDGKHILMLKGRKDSALLRELGRLRELTFRLVGEGTLKRRDNDEYDLSYRHIVLWDDRARRIVGSYRIGEAYKLVTQTGIDSLYCNRLFDLKPALQPTLSRGIELGRSFVHPDYQGKRSLDYLWQGIGAYLYRHPEVRYMFGAVSMSNDLPNLARQQIAACYAYLYQPSKWSKLAIGRMPFHIDRCIRESFRDLSRDEALDRLRSTLQLQGVTVPMLFKHYSELCQPQGTHMIDFNVDPNFSYSVDALMLVDLDHIHNNKKERYIRAATN